MKMDVIIRLPRVIAAAAVFSLIAVPAQSETAAGEAIPAMEEHVFLTVEQALEETFPRARAFDIEARPVSVEMRESLRRKLGRAVSDDTLFVHRARGASGELLGYAVVSDEIGKYRPITYMVGTTPDLTVQRVLVLVYRESHGGSVRRTRFLKQYRGKTYDSPLRTNRDIINITGATLSVRSLNHGVKKVLGFLTEIYGAPEEEQP